MNRYFLLALTMLVSTFVLTNTADARRAKKVAQAEPCFFICEQGPVQEYRVTRRGKRVAVRSNRRMGASKMTGIVTPLAAKVAQIQAACGSSVISGVRHTRIAGTRRMSLHAQGKAVDMVGNPSCMYSQLQGWSGGYSTDYGRARHIHISYDAEGGREMGLRFVHGGHRKHARKHVRHRYAVAR